MFESVSGGSRTRGQHLGCCSRPVLHQGLFALQERLCSYSCNLITVDFGMPRRCPRGAAQSASREHPVTGDRNIRCDRWLINHEGACATLTGGHPLESTLRAGGQPEPHESWTSLRKRPVSERWSSGAGRGNHQNNKKKIVIVSPVASFTFEGVTEDGEQTVSVSQCVTIWQRSHLTNRSDCCGSEQDRVCGAATPQHKTKTIWFSARLYFYGCFTCKFCRERREWAQISSPLQH